MANIFWKHLNICFSHFKCLPTSLPSPSSPPHQTLVTKNPSFSVSSDSPPPDFSSLYTSNRFFFSSPGQSNSILDSPERSSPATPVRTAAVDGGVAVQTDSPDPYSDFRKSMQEMVEAREYTDVEGDWDFLHELLLCYLMLNPKHTHKFIVDAFSDLLISLMASTSFSRPKVDKRRRGDKSPDDSVCCSSSTGPECDFSFR